jgi:Aminotransferase class I and II
VIKFAAEEKLVVMADEVYQTNIFLGTFTSFKKGLRDLQKAEPGKYDNVELASLQSISKGMVGECGHRGGYFELVGFDAEVQAQIYKFISIMLCPPVVGQCLVEMMVNPPKRGDPSFELYDREYNDIKEGLRERAYALYEAFRKMEGVELGEPQVSALPQTSFSLVLTQYPPGMLTPTVLNRDPCISSPQSTFPHVPSKLPRRRSVNRTSSTASIFSTRQASVSCPGPGLGRNRARCISGRLSWHRGPSGWAGLWTSMRAL